MKTPDDFVEAIERRSNPIFWIAVVFVAIIIWRLLK